MHGGLAATWRLQCSSFDLDSQDTQPLENPLRASGFASQASAGQMRQPFDALLLLFRHIIIGFGVGIFRHVFRIRMITTPEFYVPVILVPDEVKFSFIL